MLQIDFLLGVPNEFTVSSLGCTVGIATDMPLFAILRMTGPPYLSSMSTKNAGLPREVNASLGLNGSGTGRPRQCDHSAMCGIAGVMALHLMLFQ
jgi:hypothetical protein